MPTQPVDVTPYLDDPEIRAAYLAQALRHDLAALLVAARKRQGVTRAQIARWADVPLSYLYRLERGDAILVGTRLERILHALGG